MNLDRIIPTLSTGEEGCRFARACTYMLGVFAIAAVVSLLQSWWGDLRLLSAADNSPLSATVLDENYLSVIPQAHLFGNYTLSSSAGIPVTASPLRLTGVITGDDTYMSKVMISYEGSVSKVYQEGDTLPEGLRITTITQDGVILDNGGHPERLPLVRPKLEFLS